jgi:hypothetical protein
MMLCSVQAAPAQRLSSYSAAAGAAFQEDARTTAAFSVSAGVHWLLPWMTMLQQSVAELKSDSLAGTVRDVSLAVLPIWEPWDGRIALGVGGSLHQLRREHINMPDLRDTRAAVTGIAGLRLPLAGAGVLLELLGRADALDPTPQFSAFLGVRVRAGVPNTLRLGEPATPARVAARAVWNDVVMQLVLLQQDLESFTRIREIETGIELEFDQRAFTLYDDIAKAARVLAAADPPVLVTVFAPNAGRAGAAVTAGSFPAERLRLQRDTRVYLRVER